MTRKQELDIIHDKLVERLKHQVHEKGFYSEEQHKVVKETVDDLDKVIKERKALR